MVRKVRWIKAASKAAARFPVPVQRQIARALDVAARGEMTEVAKPFKGVGSGVFEIALRHQTDAYRAVYAVKLDEDIWVIQAFQKKSTSGIKTPVQEVDLIRERLKRLNRELS